MSALEGPAPEPAGTPELSRRALIGGITAAGALGLVAAGAVPGGTVHAAPGDQTEALGAVIAGLTYITLDATAFDVAGTSPTAYRIYQESPPTGVQPSNAPTFVFAPLTIPVGSTVRQINISCVGQPSFSIARRDFTTGALTDVSGPHFAAGSSGLQTSNFAVDVTLEHGSSYVVKAFCSAGQSVLGMSLGYVPAPQAFIPFTGNNPRALDTREGGRTRFGANEERVVDLSSLLIPTARAAVINLTAVDVSGGGFLSAYADGIEWPRNSTVNYSTAGQTVANAAVVTMANGRIKVRAGVNGAHVIVDVVGSLL